jgi:hypothetical protein
MKSLRMAVLAVALAAAASAGAADERPTASPETLSVARELFAVTFERAGVELNARAVELAWPSLENALRARNPGLDAAALADLRREFEGIRLHKMQELVKDAPSIYARYLSQEEMRDIIAFYRTPSGTKLMRLVPPMVAEIFAIVLPGMPAVVSDTHEEFLQVARERGVVK